MTSGPTKGPAESHTEGVTLIHEPTPTVTATPNDSLESTAQDVDSEAKDVASEASGSGITSDDVITEIGEDGQTGGLENIATDGGHDESKDVGTDGPIGGGNAAKDVGTEDSGSGVTIDDVVTEVGVAGSFGTDGPIHSGNAAKDVGTEDSGPGVTSSAEDVAAGGLENELTSDAGPDANGSDQDSTSESDDSGISDDSLEGREENTSNDLTDGSSGEQQPSGSGQGSGNGGDSNSGILNPNPGGNTGPGNQGSGHWGQNPNGGNTGNVGNLGPGWSINPIIGKGVDWIKNPFNEVGNLGKDFFGNTFGVLGRG